MKTALITGITGQDGAYLAELLLHKGYRVVGAYRRTSTANFWRIEALGIAGHAHLELVPFDLNDMGLAIRLLRHYRIDEVYNLAAQSFVGVSFDEPVTTAQVTGLGALNLLEAIRVVDTGIRFYQASTSEMFGKAESVPQREDTRFHPRSPYGVAKLYAHWITVNYREAYGIFGASGVLFNHESPLRGKQFVTRKITDAVARIRAGSLDVLELGNLDAQRDWGFAPEYVAGMWSMLQRDAPDTYVLATGRIASVRDFATMAFAAAGFDVQWHASGVDERGVDAGAGKTLVRVDAGFWRPAEVDQLVGDASKARDELGWEPQTPLETLCRMMVEADLRRNGCGTDA